MGVNCPCCSAAVPVPSLDDLAADLLPMEAAVLRAAWAGKGHPVTSSEMFDVMYADDPNGGPSPSRAYLHLQSAIKSVGEKLAGTGVSIVPVGYRQGFRLNLKGGAR